MKDKIYFSGLIIIVISVIVCIISFYLLVFGIPTFIFGAILVFISKQAIKTKLLTSLIPIVLYVPMTYLFLLIYNYSTPKTILIPANYEGNLRVIYEEKCGKNYEELDGRQTLNFPANGILILNEDFDRHINYNYYLIDKLGHKKEILQTFDFNDRTKKLPCIVFFGSGVIGQAIEVNSTNKGKKGITFSDFYIYNKDTTDRNDFKSRDKFDSLTTEIVNRCRQIR